MKYSAENFVYGVIDGAVTTFAVVTGVIRASLTINNCDIRICKFTG